MIDMYMVAYDFPQHVSSEGWSYLYYGEGKEWADSTLKWLHKFRANIQHIKLFKLPREKSKGEI
jgi:hypothetical protein